MSVVKIAKIQGNLHVPNPSDTIAMLTSVIPDTMQITWKKNSEYQMQFEAYNNGSDAYSMLSPGNMVEKNGQWFVIKHPTAGWSGNLETTSVVATHISSEINRIHIYGDDAPTDFGSYDHAGKSQSVTSVSNGNAETAVSVSVNDIMQWAFGDQQSRWGITYQIIGSFNSQMAVGTYASGSGKDIISRILAAWTDAVFWPDNLNLRIYSHDEFYKNRGHRLDYLHDTDTVTLEYDTTDMVNAARLVGAMQESGGGSSKTVDNAEITNSDSQSTYYFAPFYFVDEESKKRWGLYEGDDITSDTITDKEQMKAYAEAQFKPNPDVSLELTAIDWQAIPGDLVRVEIKPANYVTQTGVVGIVSYPDSATSKTTITLSSNLQTILDYQRGQQAELKSYRDSTRNMIINAQFNSQAQITWNETEVKAFESSKRG